MDMTKAEHAQKYKELSDLVANEFKRYQLLIERAVRLGAKEERADRLDGIITKMEGKIMDIERNGEMVRDVVEFEKGSFFREERGWHYAKKYGDGSSTFYDDTWTPVNPWVTIEVERETFERLYGDLPAGYTDVLFYDNSERGAMIRWRKLSPSMPQNEERTVLYGQRYVKHADGTVESEGPA